ncbi:MAG TPA: argininosuccinate lyase, partial [bacterium]|nr:argininosuccinate lyase [bacterium]
MAGRAPRRMWGGRFGEPPDPRLLAFTASLSVDRRLLRWDAIASIAHALTLRDAGLLTAADAEAIIGGLRHILRDVEEGRLSVGGDHEDVHSFLEAELYARIGPPAGRLHTGRSRNDQVVTAFRLTLRQQLVELVGEVQALMAAGVERAASSIDDILPAFTHLQHAQPVRLAHHLLAYVWMLERDAARLEAAHARADVLPLGAGAIAGAGFPLDRARAAALLGFARITENSIDAVGDRDFAVEAAAAAALLAAHLSRWADEVVLWASDEFGFVVLSDRVATGSSLMPQKKNPDAAELIRGRAARPAGDLVTLLGMLKGLPAGYHRDLQEDKAATFDALDTAAGCARAMRLVLDGVRFVPERMRQAAGQGWLTATEVADYLVRRGIPFREAHALAGAVVQRAAARGTPLWELPLADYQAVSPLFQSDILEAVTLEASVEAKDVPGGTARRRVLDQLAAARQALER